MSDARKTVVVTGAAGMIGRHFCDHMRRQGWSVRGLMRDPSAYPFTEPGIERFSLDLPGAVPDAAFPGADVVVHAAWAIGHGHSSAATRVNVEGSRAILDASRGANARFVFVSSFSARDGAESAYGRDKWRVERSLDPAVDLIIRPGLVMAADGGLASRMWKAVARSRVYPVLRGGRQIVQTIHIDDLVAAMRVAIEQCATGSLALAEPEGIQIRQLMHAMGRAAGVSATPVPLPAGPLLATMHLLERLGPPLPVGSESLLGLLAMQHVETRADLARLGVSVRPTAESIADLAPAFRMGRR